MSQNITCTVRVPEMPQLIPGLTAEQSQNTVEFLTLVAETCSGSRRCLVMEEHPLTRDTYLRQRNHETGKMEYVLQNGERIIKGRKGIDTCKPTILEVAKSKELMMEHKFYYEQKAQKVFPYIHPKTGRFEIYKEDKWDCITRPPILDTIIKMEETSQRIYFLPTLIKPKSLIKKCKAASKGTYCVMNNYSSKDVVAGRCVWVEIDAHDCPIANIYHANLRALDRLTALLPAYCHHTGIPMPIVVNSGQGVHLYWWFDREIELKNEETRTEYQLLLMRMANWVKELINQDQICSELWKVNYKAATLYYLMSLPGCVHPQTGQRQYVVNKYGKDYQLYTYDVIRDSVKNECEPESQVTHKEVVDQNITSENPCQDEAMRSISHETLEDPVHEGKEDILNLEGRIKRLLHWAEGRSWNLTGRRELFLFCCGVVLQCGATFDLTDEANYPLHELNNRFTEPLTGNEVDILIRKLVGRAKTNNVYKMSDQKIAEKLCMTAEEQEWFCEPARLSAESERTPVFKEKFLEILEQEPWNDENESIEAHRDRCYQLTCKWYKDRRQAHNGKIYSNAARTSRRKAKPGYTKKGGRPTKYTEEDCEMCQSLRQKGMSIRQIADQTGIPKSAVGRMLKL